ncbi:protein WVD2-like 1 [Zingiber officinale]|uniref:protein WVD2-like 1 n=1 Tax=Zingiber officinale TaxID=94328 RepID=UPI001C4D11C5|nr:protein WVD2-like 1 [Zingiber officinale]
MAPPIEKGGAVNSITELNVVQRRGGDRHRHGSTDEATASKEKHGGADNSHLQPDMKVDQTVTGYRYSVAPLLSKHVKEEQLSLLLLLSDALNLQKSEKKYCIFSIKFYTKLEQKHHSMEAEKMQFEARMREEQEEALKEFRKNLNFKANPVLRF